MSTVELRDRVAVIAFEAMMLAQSTKLEDHVDLVEDFVDDVMAELCYTEPDPISVWAWPAITFMAAIVGVMAGYYFAGGKLL